MARAGRGGGGGGAGGASAGGPEGQQGSGWVVGSIIGPKVGTGFVEEVGPGTAKASHTARSIPLSPSWGGGGRDLSGAGTAAVSLGTSTWGTGENLFL